MSFTVCGLDEVGRGALAGPLMAVASLFSCQLVDGFCWEMRDSPISGVMDSKKFTSPEKRREVYHRILRHPLLLDFGIGEVSVEEINDIGIDKANDLAFRRAVMQLSPLPNFIIVDGKNPLYGWDIGSQRVVPKADDLYWPVGAASILAKVIRDNYMRELGADYSQYQWAKNAGYGTKEHTEALLTYGSTPYHRKAFIKAFRRTV